MKPHKHADVLRAIADGREVQVYVNDVWIDVGEDALYTRFDPFCNRAYKWRVKPEPFAWLDSEEFYEICQQYRHVKDYDWADVVTSEKFAMLKDFIKEKVREMK
jgi:hypothetical protein